VFATGNGRKTDPVDAHSVALAALRAPGLAQVQVEEDLVVMGMLADRREATGTERALGLGGDLAALAALRDEESAAREEIEELRREPRIRDVPNQAAVVEYALAVLYNGLARYPEALAAAQRSRARHAAGGFGQALAEAAVRCHQPEVAQTALDALTVRTQLSDTDWGLGVEARSRALLAEGSAAEELYLEAIERLSQTRMRLPLARAHLVYGEWLRRERRRSDARDHLRTAHDLFEAIGSQIVRGPGAARAGRHRRQRAQPPQRHPRRAHPPGSTHRQPR